MDNNIIQHPPEPESDENSTQHRIIRAARSEFAEHGLAGARVDQIARTAGVNKAMIYYHFTSKQRLYEAVIESHFYLIAQRLRSEIPTDADLETALIQVARTYTSVMTESDEFRSLMLRELAQPTGPLFDRLAGLISHTGVPRLLATTIEAGQKEGRLRRADVRHLMVSFITMNFGYFVLRPLTDRILKVEDTDLFVSQRPAEVVSLFLNGLKARES